MEFSAIYAEKPYLNLGVWFSGFDVLAAIHEEADKLAWTRTPKLSGIILLLDQAGL